MKERELPGQLSIFDLFEKSQTMMSHIISI